MADLKIDLRFRVTPAFFRWGLGVLLLSSLGSELASESVTLTTYYPAPSGVYNQMITTGNTFLARDGGFVDIGTTANLTAGNGMAVMNGNVGIGSTNPLSQLWTQSQGCWNWSQCAGWGDFNVGNGTFGISFGVATGGGGAGDARIWTTGGTRRLMFGNPVDGDTLAINRGNVGIGTITPATPLDVNGIITTRGWTGAACNPGSAIPFGSGVTSCATGKYATMITGLISKYQIINDPGDPGGEMFCCDCPGGSCPSF